MRILLDCRMASWTGIGRYATGLARALAATNGLELVQMVAAGESPPAPVGGAVSAYEASRHPFTVAGGREFARMARAISPDVTHSTHFPTPMPAAHPLVVTLHDLTPLIIPEVMPSAFKRAVYRYWNARAAQVGDTILADSEHTASDIRRIFPAAAHKTRVVQITAGGFADAGPVGEVPAGLIGPGERYVLSMGNTKPNKDLPTLLRAFARIAPGHPDLRLLLVGADAPGFVDSVLAADPACARIAFTGRVDDATLRALYAGAAAFAFPSRYEGFGLPPLEAMALRAPVVVAHAASLPEVVGDAALTFAVGDDAELAARLTDLLGDVALCERLIASGVERAAHFTWERTAAETIAAYRDLLDQR
ncbi:MAG: glycosyltransferase family 4 protein [Coriobacteriia bacterium]|nr:glycosyltransferase family 4 protein [Coriobacteriia bacterium]